MDDSYQLYGNGKEERGQTTGSSSAGAAASAAAAEHNKSGRRRPPPTLVQARARNCSSSEEFACHSPLPARLQASHARPPNADAKPTDQAHRQRPLGESLTSNDQDLFEQLILMDMEGKFKSSLALASLSARPPTWPPPARQSTCPTSKFRTRLASWLRAAAPPTPMTNPDARKLAPLGTSKYRRAASPLARPPARRSLKQPETCKQILRRPNLVPPQPACLHLAQPDRYYYCCY